MCGTALGRLLPKINKNFFVIRDVQWKHEMGVYSYHDEGHNIEVKAIIISKCLYCLKGLSTRNAHVMYESHMSNG